MQAGMMDAEAECGSRYSRVLDGILQKLLPKTFTSSQVQEEQASFAQPLCLGEWDGNAPRVSSFFKLSAAAVDALKSIHTACKEVHSIYTRSRNCGGGLSLNMRDSVRRLKQQIEELIIKDIQPHQSRKYRTGKYICMDNANWGEEP